MCFYKNISEFCFSDINIYCFTKSLSGDGIFCNNQLFINCNIQFIMKKRIFKIVGLLLFLGLGLAFFSIQTVTSQTTYTTTCYYYCTCGTKNTYSCTQQRPFTMNCSKCGTEAKFP